MPKMFRFDDQARRALKSGVDQMAAAVRVTLGPCGRPVLLDRRKGGAVLTSDGATIVRDIELADPYENLGVQLLREVASKTAELAGDGTTTATLLAQQIVSPGLDAVVAGQNPTQIKRGIDRAVERVVGELRQQARPVASRKELFTIASAAARHDASLGELVATALEQVGPTGLVQVEIAPRPALSLSFLPGTRFDRGYISPYFVNDAERMEAVLQRPFILVTDQTLTTIEELAPLLEQVAAAGAPLLLVADDVEGEALATLVLNHLKGVLEVAAVKAPGFGDGRGQWLRDLARATGGTFFSREQGPPLAEADLSRLGRAPRVQIGRDATLVLLESADAGGDAMGAPIAQIEVGGSSDAETQDLRTRVEDALHATRAAMEEGIVAGGGVALLRAARAIEACEPRSAGEQCGLAIVHAATQSPARAIADNAGYDGSAIVEEIRRRSDGFGFDAERGEFVDLFGAGVVDPTKVSRLALVHAASIGSLILTTETLVADKPDEREPDA